MYISCPIAFGTRVVHQFTFAPALGTGICRYVLRISLVADTLDLSLPAAGLAHVALTIHRTGAVALVAPYRHRRSDLPFHPPGRILQTDLDVQSQVLSRAGTMLLTAAEELEQITELRAGHVPEDVVQVLLVREVLP